MNDSGVKTRQLYSESAIEVYTGTLSARPGDEVTIHVSTSLDRYNLQVARIGQETEVVWSRDDLEGAFYETPVDAARTGCDWPTAVTITIPEDWRSGYYEILATARADDGAEESFRAFVVVRPTAPTSPILLVLSTNTYAAYNFYGGANLYQLFDAETGDAHRVSLRRPWMPGFLWKPEEYDIHTDSLVANMNSVDRFWRDPEHGVPWLTCAAGWANWERVMVAWLERNGYEVDYAINGDLDADPHALDGYRLVVSVGHDEYWSWNMRDAVESFVARGGNVCFFSGNVAGWQIRHEDDGESLVCYKDDYRDDPVYADDPRRATTLWMHRELDRPESRMTGVSILYAGFSRFHTIALNGPRGHLVYRPEHWIFEGSGMGYGDCLGQNGIILRYELDGCPIRMERGLPHPESFHDAPSSFQILGMAPASLEAHEWPPTLSEYIRIHGPADPRVADYIGDNRGHAIMGIYTENGTVFTAGTTDWTNGLTGQDPAVEQITRNLLDRLSAS
jgi:hypothetical protein